MELYCYLFSSNHNMKHKTLAQCTSIQHHLAGNTLNSLSTSEILRLVTNSFLYMRIEKRVIVKYVLNITVTVDISGS